MGKALRLQNKTNSRPARNTDLEPYQIAVNASAARVRGLWLGFIALLAYLFVSVGAVTHRDLLLQSPVKLPLLDVNLPLVGFFAIAPILLIINHFYLLLQLLGLGRRLKDFRVEIGAAKLDDKARKIERRKLDTFVIVQMLGGAAEERSSWNGFLLRSVAFITLVIAPVLLLVFVQLQFLAFQDWRVTSIHRVALGLDLFVVWRFWPSIKLGHWAPWLSAPFGALVSIVLLFFSLALATFPGEVSDIGFTAKEWGKPGDSRFAGVKKYLFGDLSLDVPAPGGLVPFSRALELSDHSTLINLDTLDKIRERQSKYDDGLERWQTGRTIDLRKRSLRSARFDRSDLRNVHFDEAQLQNASLRGASLHGASLANADFQGAWFQGASLQGATLERSLLIGARFDAASLQDAKLSFAILSGATLIDAGLSGANLDNAQLQGAFLDRAHLQGASLVNTQLQGTTIDEALMHGALLDGAWLHGASLRNARLDGASLHSAVLHGANLDGVVLHGTLLDDAELYGATLRGAKLLATSMKRAGLWRTLGIPNAASTRGAFIADVQTEPISESQLEIVRTNALLGVRDERLRQRILASISRLDDPSNIFKETVFRNEWIYDVRYETELSYKKARDDYLGALMCASDYAPYVAHGLMKKPVLQSRKSRVEEMSDAAFFALVEKLAKAVQEDDPNCLGVRALAREHIRTLRKWRSVNSSGAPDPAIPTTRPAAGGDRKPQH